MRSISKLLALVLALIALVPAFAEEAQPTPAFAGLVKPAPSSTPAVSRVVDSAFEDDGLIRVWLTSLGAPSELHLTTAGDYAVESNAGFRFERGAELTVLARDGEVLIASGGMILNMGEAVTLTRHSQSGLYIHESERQTLYNGDLCLSADGDALRAILVTGMEEYLLGVVGYEMSDSFPIEALKAQAVAARTYAMQRKFSSGGREYDLVDTTADQVFKGFNPDYKNVIAAVEATRGVVGTWKDGFAACYYTASNGGEVAKPADVWSGDGDYGYILRHADPYDLENPSSMVYSYPFSSNLSDAEALVQLLSEKVSRQVFEPFEIAAVNAVVPMNPEPAGTTRYTALRFDLTLFIPDMEPTPEPAPSPTPTPKPWLFFFGMDAQPTTAPEPVAPRYEVRNVSVELSVYEDVKHGLSLALNGADYERVSVSETESGFSIEMRCYGHGIGMSQRGAQWMAGEYGKSWEQILSFYYPGMRLERIAWQDVKIEPMAALPSVPPLERPEPTPKPTPMPLPPLEEGEYYGTVKVDSLLNIRERPTTQSRVLDKFENGRELIVCGEPDANGWIPIRTAELQGFIKIEYLESPNE